MNSSGSNRFNAILILDSIPEGERNTARELEEDLKVARAAYGTTPGVHRERAPSADALFSFIIDCKRLIREQNIFPMLHIECHGGEDGLECADGSMIDWMELKQPLTDLNIEMRLNLMVAVAACKGSALATMTNMSERAPFWGLIGPTINLSPKALMRSYYEMYSTLFRTGSPKKALDAYRETAGDGNYWIITAQGLFEKGWRRYKEIYCSDEALTNRITRMRFRAIESRRDPFPTQEELKKRLIDHEPIALKRFISTFFMHDLYPENKQRFNLKIDGIIM